MMKDPYDFCSGLSVRSSFVSRWKPVEPSRDLAANLCQWWGMLSGHEDWAILRRLNVSHHPTFCALGAVLRLPESMK